MAIKKIKRNSLYGYPAPTSFAFPAPVVSNRNPTVFDFGELGQGWINKVLSIPFQLTQISAGQYIWTQIGAAGGGLSGASLTVTPGPISLTGTTTINTTGAASTSIGTGGTGVVNIGNATGNTIITGTLAVTSNITSNTGNILASSGNVTAGLDLVAEAGVAEAVSLVATGDIGSGTTATTIFTNLAPANAGGTGVCVIQTNTGTGTPDNVGFIKIYIGTTEYYIPYFDATVL